MYKKSLSRRTFGAQTMDVVGSAVVAAACRPLGVLPGPGGQKNPAIDPEKWASGGTASMQGEYLDPFTDAVPAACSLTCAMTRGPCYAETLERRDISEGYPGLPVRLALRVVDPACQPVAGAAVDIWHTSAAGLYSGPDAIDMCTRNDADAESHRFFRGVQITDENGRVDFDTIVPGWYSGRTVHFHFSVRRGADEYVVAQLVFDDPLIEAVTTMHPDYAARGAPDTWNDTDLIVHDAIERVLLATALQPDGALLAWKTLVIRSSLDESLCDRDEGAPEMP